MFDWLSGLDVRIQAGLIAGLVMVFVVFLREVVFARMAERRSARRSQLEIYRSYADPLASAATSLFWRLHEVFLKEGRGAFLNVGAKATEFEKYKQDSTLFRLASLLGWIRAYRRELAVLPHSNQKTLRKLHSAIDDFEVALSDGAHVEEQRVQSISALWRFELPNDRSECEAIFTAVEQVLKNALHEESISAASELSTTAQTNLCVSAANILATRLKSKPIPKDVIEESRERAIQGLSIREAWIYRDFQTGIGDLMLSEMKDGMRRFEVIGYGEFEALLHSTDEGTRRWMRRLSKTIEDLDVSGADRFDARVQLLENSFLAAAKLVGALAEIDLTRNIVSAATLKEAQEVKSSNGWKRSILST